MIRLKCHKTTENRQEKLTLGDSSGADHIVVELSKGALCESNVMNYNSD